MQFMLRVVFIVIEIFVIINFVYKLYVSDCRSYINANYRYLNGSKVLYSLYWGSMSQFIVEQRRLEEEADREMQ